MAARGIKTGRSHRNGSQVNAPMPWGMYDVRGLEETIGEAYRSGQPGQVDITFAECYSVIDRTRFGGQRLRLRDVLKIPSFTVVFEQGTDNGYAIVGHGGDHGTFFHPGGWPDNNCWQPSRFHGTALMLSKPARLYASLPDGEQVPFDIAGLVGLEDRVVLEIAAGQRRNGHRQYDAVKR